MKKINYKKTVILLLNTILMYEVFFKFYTFSQLKNNRNFILPIALCGKINQDNIVIELTKHNVAFFYFGRNNSIAKHFSTSRFHIKDRYIYFSSIEPMLPFIPIEGLLNNQKMGVVLNTKIGIFKNNNCYLTPSEASLPFQNIPPVDFTYFFLSSTKAQYFGEY